MHRYDPEQAPAPTEWLALDQQVRINLVEQYHHAHGIELPNAKAHAVFHAIIENQLAEGVSAVVRAVARFAAEGLSRHEALHAIGSMLAEHIYNLKTSGSTAGPSSADYYTALENLTVAKWRRG